MISWSAIFYHLMKTFVNTQQMMVDVIRVPGDASDHRLVIWPFVAAPAETPIYKPSIADPGDGSTLNGSDLTLSPPVFVMAHWVHLRLTMLLPRPSGSTRLSRIYSTHTRR